jgi:hypothetical protein
MRMSEIEISEYARQLLEARGDKAVVAAAQKACAMRRKGRPRKQKLGDTSKPR